MACRECLSSRSGFVPAQIVLVTSISNLPYTSQNNLTKSVTPMTSGDDALASGRSVNNSTLVPMTSAQALSFQFIPRLHQLLLQTLEVLDCHLKYIGFGVRPTTKAVSSTAITVVSNLTHTVAHGTIIICATSETSWG